MFNRACVAIAYFAFLSLLFFRGIPHYATVPLILLGVLGLMILALLVGVYWTAPNARERKQVSLLTVFIFTAACAMLLGTVTGLIRAAGRLTLTDRLRASPLLRARARSSSRHAVTSDSFLPGGTPLRSLPSEGTSA